MCFMLYKLQVQNYFVLSSLVIIIVSIMDSTAGGSNCEEIYINRKTLIEYYRESASRKDSDKLQFLYKKVEHALRMTNISSDFKSVLSKLINVYKVKLEKSNRHFERCVSMNKDWFDAYVSFSVPQTRTSESGGRPIKDFEECSERTKRQKTEHVRSQLTSAELAYATQMQYRADGDIKKSKLIKNVSQDLIPSTEKGHSSLNPDKALSTFIEGQFSKYQYNVLRKSALEVGCNLYPNYETITEAKKKCYPHNIKNTETKSEVPLQNLMDHTAERLLLSLNEVILTLTETQRQNIYLISKWGCDGSGSHSQYKQKFQSTESSDEYMLITSVVPIRLMCINESKKTDIIWQNPRPSSPRYCRPLRLQMAHETAEISKIEAASVKKQITELTPTKTEICCIKHDLKLTMVDGKMINALTNTSSAMRCYICELTSKDFNNLKKCINKPIKNENLEYGISSLHAWIRLAECILHLGYKLKLGKWQARGARDKNIVAAEKARIQKEFWERKGLHVDKPRQGGGTSTDGNTARALFLHASDTSEITGVNLNIINRFHTILKVISSGYRINIKKFNTFCLQAASSFVFYYPWFNMPTTLHKILVHGPLIVENIGIAIGLFSEDAQESRNKDIRKYREQFSRKFSRQLAMQDTFQRLLVSSDPYISGLRQLQPKKPITFTTVELNLIEENFD